jgi:hypothetical protein
MAVQATTEGQSGMTITQWAVVSKSGAVLYVYDFESDAQAAQEDHEGSTVVKLTGKME